MTGDELHHPLEATAEDDDMCGGGQSAPAELVALHHYAAGRSRKSARSSRRGSFAALGASLVIHAFVLMLLVRAGILFVPASVAVQGGATSGTAVDDLPGDGNVMPSGAAAMPLVRWSSASLLVNPFHSELTAPELPLVPDAPSDLASRLQNLDSTPQPIGLATDVIALPDATFPHHYPAGWRAAHATAGGNGGAPAAKGSGDTASPHASAAAGEAAGYRGAGQGAAGFGPSGSARNKPPSYPAEARRRKYEGTVWLLVEVAEDGSVGSIFIDQTSGHDILDQAALDAVKRWVFAPAQEDGRPARSQCRVPIRFVLHG